MKRKKDFFELLNGFVVKKSFQNQKSILKVVKEKTLIGNWHIIILIYIRFVASKINYIEVSDKSYYRALEKAIIIVDFFDENNEIIKEFNSNFKRGSKISE